MPLIITVFLAGLFIEVLGMIISVMGVSASFNGNLIIIAFVLALDIGKVVTISAVYQYWDRITWKFKIIGPFVIITTMAISSVSAYGYFSSEFEKSMSGTREITLKTEALQTQLRKYELRKTEIDSQIANLPERTSVQQRIRMINAFKAEQQAITARIVEIENQLPEMQTQQIAAEADTGPIFALAKTLDITVETSLKLVVGLLILVFNPFAVFLIYMGNFMLKQRTAESVVVSKIANVPNAVETEVNEGVSNAMKVPTVAQEVEPQYVVQEPVVQEPVVQEPENLVHLGPDEMVSREPEPKVTPEEHAARSEHVSLLLDKALDHIKDDSIIEATPLINTHSVRNTYR